MKKRYIYEQDSAFLEQIDKQRIVKQYVKITLLNWNEEPIREVQGLVTGGSLNLNGDSSIRRTCNLSAFIPKEIGNSDISNPDNLFSLNKKMYLEIGVDNKTDKYEDYPIIWFRQGVFIIMSASTSHGTDGIDISLQLQDKMCLLNGSCGGTIPASTRFDLYDTIDENGEWVTEQPVISRIIRELVNHWGGEQLGRIIISDIDDRIKIAMRWIGDNPIYGVYKNGTYQLTLDQSAAGDAFIEYNWGEDVGYSYTDFTYPSELTANPGDNVCTILDAIKGTLGNYEYFYDIDGNFKFQEIKNYLNTTQAKVDLDNIHKNQYLVDITKGQAVYSFNDSSLITSYSNSPQYSNIKNDYVVWGTRENSEGIKVPIRYHLAIDKKPTIGNIYNVFFYTDDEDGLTKAKVPVQFKDYSHFPEKGAAGVFYMDNSTGVIYKWDGELGSYVIITGEKIETYLTRSDFPEKGEKDTVYIAEINNQEYSWSLDTSSTHYQEVQTKIDNLTNSYNLKEADNVNNQSILQNSLDEKQQELEDVNSQLNPIQQELGNIESLLTKEQNAVTKLQNEITEAEEVYWDDQDNLEIINNRIDLLNEDLENLQNMSLTEKSGTTIELTNSEEASLSNFEISGVLIKGNNQLVTITNRAISITADSGKYQNSMVYYLEAGQWLTNRDKIINGYLVNNTNRIRLQGGENWTLENGQFKLTVSQKVLPGDVICSHDNVSATQKNNDQYHIYFTVANMTLSQWKQYLTDQYTSDSPVTIFYQTEEKNTELYKVGDLSTYNPKTVITNDLGLLMTITYTINTYSSEINDTLEDLSNAQKVKQELEREIDILPSQKEDMEKLLLEKQFLVNNYQSKIDSLQSQISPLTQDKNEIEDAIKVLQDQINQLLEQERILLSEFKEQLSELTEEQYEYVTTQTVKMEKVQTTDWRSELYLQGAAAEPLGLSSNYYYTELSAEWPKIYDLRKSHYTDENGNLIYTGGFIDDVINNPSIMDYYLDFIDSNAAVSKFNVNAIGRRSKVESSDDYNCIFEPVIPDYILIQSGQADTAKLRKECEDKAQAYIQVDSSIYEALATGGASNGCFEEVKMLLYQYTGYNESISLSTVPIYHLEPNTRISVTDVDSGIYGDYVINSISIPLTIGGTTSISATRATERL